MFRSKIFYLVLILLTCLHVTASPSTLSEIQREVIVMFKPGVINLHESSIVVPLDSVAIPSPALRSALSRFNPELILKAFPEHDPADTIATNEFGQVIKKLDLSLIYKIRLPEGTSRDTLINILDTITEVIYAEPNGTPEFPSLVFPDDQYFGSQWGLYNTGQFGGVYRADIHAPEAWEIAKGNSSIKIGIIDTGVDGGHPDLSGKVSGDAGYSDDHGTHVAGIASAKTNNTIGVAGVDWNAQIISQRNDGDAEYVYDAIVDAVNSGAHVLNNSWSWPEGYSVTIRSAFAYAYKMNRVATAAMGNDWGAVIKYPAAFGQGIIAVGATDYSDVKAGFSNTGDHIDVSAPGVYIYSTVPATYSYKSGTSMATPFVTGLASLLKGYKSNLYNDDIEQIIRISADTVLAMGGQEWTPEYGDGRINARKAFELLQYPNYLVHSTASGAYNAGNTTGYWMAFYTTPNLATGVYYVKRYEARKDITLPREFLGTPYVWGRGVGSTGYSGASPNFAMGYCYVVPGSITSTSATLSSFVYDVWDFEMNHIGWIPCAPENVSFAYSVLGEPKLLASTLSATRSYVGASPWIGVGWTDPNVNEAEYKLERKDATNNQWSEIASLDSNHTGWTDFNLVGSETYTYRVRSHNIHQISDYSNEKVIKARPNPPANFQAEVECLSYGVPKVIPVSPQSQTNPPTLYDGPPPVCTGYSNKVFLSWSPPANQKLPISYYGVRIQEINGPVNYDGPIYGLVDTLCLGTDKSYFLYVFCLDSEGDTSYWSSRQIVTTGYINNCSGDSLGWEKAYWTQNLPDNFFLTQNYPNPFNSGTSIEYGLTEDTHVRLIIYNVLGEKVRVLVDEFQSAGIRNIFWDGRNDRGEEVASGIYFYQIKAGSFTKTAKMSLLK